MVSGAMLCLTAVAILALPLWTLPALAQGPDFDGDGFDDLAIGAPGEFMSSPSEGVVHALYGTASGLSSEGTQLWHQDQPNVLGEVDGADQFGMALAWGDFDGDGFDDLAIGAPGDRVGGVAAGAVNVLYGSGGGLATSGNQLWNRESPGVSGTSEGSDRFGMALAAGDFDADGFDDLAIGVPGDNVIVRSTTIFDAGSVHVLYGSAAGLIAGGNQLWSQNTPDVLDSAEEDDSFGIPLAVGDFDGDSFDDLAVGVRSEELLDKDEVGAAHVLYGSAAGLASDGNQFWNQTNLPDDPEWVDIFASSLAAGDFDGDGLDDLAVGVPRETVAASQIKAGAVQVLYGTPAGLTRLGTQLWHQDVLGVEDAAEVGDRFGNSVAAADFDGDGFDDLAVGVENERVGRNDVSGGAVNVIYGSTDGLKAAGDQFWHQDQPGVLGIAASGELFGDALGGGDFDGDGMADLAVGVAADFREPTGFGPGSVQVLYGAAAGLTAAGDQLWHQNSPGIPDVREAGDVFGRGVTGPSGAAWPF